MAASLPQASVSRRLLATARFADDGLGGDQDSFRRFFRLGEAAQHCFRAARSMLMTCRRSTDPPMRREIDASNRWTHTR